MAEALSVLTRVLAPIAPHVTHHAWTLFEMPSALIDSDWPRVDADALVSDRVNLVVQVNGKRRAEIEVSADAPDDDIVAAPSPTRRWPGMSTARPCEKASSCQVDSSIW